MKITGRAISYLPLFPLLIDLTLIYKNSNIKAWRNEKVNPLYLSQEVGLPNICKQKERGEGGESRVNRFKETSVYASSSLVLFKS